MFFSWHPGFIVLVVVVAAAAVVVVVVAGFVVGCLSFFAWRLKQQFAGTEDDAMTDTNRGEWNTCNYDDPGIGFPRDCGGTGNQWNCLPGCTPQHRACAGAAKTVQFYVRNVST